MSDNDQNQQQHPREKRRSTSKKEQIKKKISQVSTSSLALDDSWSVLDASEYLESINYGILGMADL